MTVLTDPSHGYAPPTWTWRVLTGSLVLYSLAIVMFALTPILPPAEGETVNPLEPTEVVIAVLGGFSAISLCVRLLKPKWGRGRWAYLIVGSSGFLSYVAFTAATGGQFWAVRAMFGLFLWAGILAAWGAHLEYGGNPSINERGWTGELGRRT